MESELTTTPFSRGYAQPRDLSAHRRAYLDTYAKRRASSISIQSSSAKNVTQAEQPTVVAIPIQKSVVSEVQLPAADSFTYVAPSAQSLEARQKAYLDQLARRHIEALKEASGNLETVFEITESDTDALFEDPSNEPQLQANLRVMYAGPLTSTITTNTKSASAAHVRTIVASAVLCGVMAVGIFSFIGKYEYQPVTAQPIASPVIEVETPVAAPSNGASAGNNEVVPINNEAMQPIKLVMSSIGVNASVEALGTTPAGLIAVPKSYGVVGWYNKSSVPGKAGPAVLVGHNTGHSNGVFDNLKNLKNGDLVTTSNSKGQSFTYRVTIMKEYEKDNVPMADILKPSEQSRLEIITCAGKWRSNNYTNRLVVTAELVR